MAQFNLASVLQKFNPFSTKSSIDEKNLKGFISPVQFQRYKQDATTWRNAVTEAENAWYPHRVKMQRIYIDTVLNGHVSACISRRKDLTLLRKFEFVDSKGNIDNKTTEYFQNRINGQDQNKKWFNQFIDYSLDALYYGYSLISLGDVENDTFKEITTIKRWNVSPDRLCVNSLVYSLSGVNFLDVPYNKWHVYVTTPNEIGTSPCGYGILYRVALYEILLRNVQAFNIDYVELFSAPFRVGKTTKTDEERTDFFNSLINMGSSGVAIIDPTDEIDFVESKNSGTGFNSYSDIEKRLEAKISKIILGHADALDSIPGKLGNSNEKSPAQRAMDDKQTVDGHFISTIINDELLPKMRALGFLIPDDVRVSLKNDSETEEIRANIINQAVEMNKAGLTMSPEYFTEKTGIQVQAQSNTVKPILNNKIKNKLNDIYGAKCECGKVH
jgi:Protein of unknown function (DUF935)